tara:strand:+ start:1459 stop:2748 length:1290 start_codon:yes stop_codon:yes gene_type:complete
MGFIGSANTITIRARLTKLGREKIISNNNTIFSHFVLGDSDANYYTSAILPTGKIPSNSGDLGVNGGTNDNITDGVGVNSKLYVSSPPQTLKPVYANSSNITSDISIVGESTVSGSNLTYVTISKSATTTDFTNLFKSLSLPIKSSNINTFVSVNSANGGWSDTPFSGLGNSNILLAVINNDQYGEMIDGKSIKMELPVYTGYTTGGTPTGVTTYTIYSTFPSTNITPGVLDGQYKDKSNYPQTLFGNQINVSYLVSDQIQRPNNEATKSWATGYDTNNPFSQGGKKTINIQTTTTLNSDRIAGVAYLDKGFLAITDPTIVNNIAIDFSGDPATNIINTSLGLYYYSASTYNTVINSIQNDLVQNIVCVAEMNEFVKTQNETIGIYDKPRISEIGITDSSGNILAIGKTDRHIPRCGTDMVTFDVQIVI